jgi:hypothetical protein
MRPDSCLPPEYVAEIALDKIKLTSKIDNADDADNVMKRMKALNKLITLQSEEYQEELTELNDKYSKMIEYKEELKKLNKDLEDFANRDHEMWGADMLRLENGALEFVKSKAGSLVIGGDIDELVANLKAFFENDSKYYLNYISVKIEPKKNEIKTAMKSGLITEEFCRDNKLEVKQTEKLEIKLF